MKKLILLLILIVFSGLASAQVVTPQLDSSFPVEMASAAGWRFGSAIGVQTSFAKISGETKNVDYHNIDSSLLLAYQPSNIIMELYWASPGTIYQWDQGTNTYTKTENADGRFNLALRGERNVTIGIGFRIADQDSSADTTNISLYEGSFSLRMLDNIYMAAGMQRVTEKFSTGDSRKWNRVLGGVALQFGDPLKQFFRLEASYQSSPETTADDPSISPHHGTEKLQGVTELLYDSLLFSYRYQHTTRAAVEGETDDIIEVRHRCGFGFKLGNATIGIYAGRGTETAGDKESQTDYYQATLSFGFI